MEKFQNKYRIPSARLKDWDYGSAGAYFITICTKDRANYFGAVKDGKMMHSPVGAIADVLWYEIKTHAANIELGEFVIMPNHMHGILIIHDTDGNNGNGHTGNPDNTDNTDYVETLHATSLHDADDIRNKKMASISPKSATISTIVRSYKFAVTRHANRLQLAFAWQPRFHDHLIRNSTSYDAIAAYILNNPGNWEKDKFMVRCKA